MVAALNMVAEMFLNAWTDISDPYTYQRDSITLQRGRPNQASTMQAGNSTFTLNNRDSRFTLRNPSSPYYPFLVQNSPFRLSIPSAFAGLTSYLRLETDTSSYASTNDGYPFLVQQAANNATGSSVTITLPNPTTAGNCIIVSIGANGTTTNPTISTVTLGGSAGNFASSVNNGSVNVVAIWADPNCAGGQTQVTVTTTGGSGTIQVAAFVEEWFGLTTSSVVDKTQSGSNASASATFSSGATATTAQANEIAIGVAASFPGVAVALTGPSSPWINFPEQVFSSGHNAVLTGYLPMTATGTATYSGTISPSEQYTACVATFKAVNASSLPLVITSGTMSVRIDCKITDWQQNHVLCAKDGPIGQAWALWTNGDGTLTFFHVDGSGGTHTDFSSIPVPYYSGRIAIRADYNISSQTVTFFTAPTMAGSWTQLGTVVGTSATTQAGAYGQSIQVGDGVVGLPGMFGSVFEFQLISTSTTVADPVFTSQTAGATSFTDAQSNTWTLAGTAELTSKLYRFHGFWGSSPKAAAPGTNDIFIQSTAYGINQILSNNNAPLNSPMFRAYLRLPPSLMLVDYWPAEDGQFATALGSAVGGSSMTWTGGPPTLSDFSSFVSSASIPTMNGATFQANVRTSSVVWTDNIVRFLLAIPSGDDTNGAVVCRFYTSGSVNRVDVVYGTGGSLNMQCFNSAGTLLFQTGALGFGLPTLSLCRVSVELNSVGGTHIALWVLTQNGSSSTGSTSAQSFTMGGVSRVQFGGGLVGSAMGHFSVQAVDDGINDLQAPLNAWLGETAGTRYARLAAEEGYQCRIVGPPETSYQMGYQPIDTLANILQQIENTDLGMQFEPMQALALGYRTLRSFYNQPVGCSASYQSDNLFQGFGSTADTQITANDVTATSPDGSIARQVLSTGAMSINAPPSGIGRMPTQINPNPQFDSELNSIANMYLAFRSINDDRYPSIPFQISRSETPQSLYLLEIGDYIQIPDGPTWLPNGIIKQIVAGFQETYFPQGVGPTGEIDINGIPEVPFEVMTAAGTVQRVATAGSVVSSAYTYGNTSLSVQLAPGVVSGLSGWTTAAGNFPFTIVALGMILTVTNITGPVSGTWTFTVNSTSVNGVVKNLPINTPIQLTNPLVVAL